MTADKDKRPFDCTAHHEEAATAAKVLKCEGNQLYPCLKGKRCQAARESILLPQTTHAPHHRAQACKPGS